MEKNKIAGNISNVGNVKIGDENHQYFNIVQNTFPKALTAKIPRTSQDKIVGRESELNDLHSRLFDNKQVVLVNGLGGIGKTTLAQVYVSKYWDEYRHVAWISRMSEDIINDFLTSEGLLDVLKIYREGKDSKTIFINIVTALNGMEEAPNLLVIDNADASLCNFYNYLPAQPLWHVLVTSREHIEKFDLKDIGFLSEGEATELFLKYYSRDDISEDEIKELLKIVDYHTLTIEILAKTAQTQRTDINKLKKAIENDLRANVYVDHKGDKIEKVTSYLCSIFSLSELNENEIWLLKQFVCLPSEFHPYKLLEELIKPEECQGEVVFAETIEDLTAKGWLLHNTDTDSYKMHIIISEVIKKQQTISLIDIAPLICIITEKLIIDETKDNPVDKFKWITFGKSIINICPESNYSIISILQGSLALVLQSFGDFKEAKKLLEKAISFAEKNFGVEHPQTISRYSNLASVHQSLGDYKEAKKLLEKTISFAEKNFGVEHPKTVGYYSNLAIVLKEVVEYKVAKIMLEKVMRIFEKNFGVEHPKTALCYSNLAVVLQGLGKYKEAIELLEKAMISNENNFGADHPTTAESYSNLATALKELGDNESAEALLIKAVSSAEKNYGFEHPTTAVFYSNLAGVLREIGEYDCAKKLLEKVMISNEKNFGVGHPFSAESYSNLAVVMKDLGENMASKELMEKAIISNEKNFGIEHTSTALCYSNYATLIVDIGDHEKALELSMKAVKIFIKLLPKEHPLIKIACNNYQSIKQKINEQSRR